MSKTYRISNYLTVIGIALLLLAAGIGWFVVREITGLKDDAHIINHAGVVRGSIQRIGKLASMGEPVGDLIGQVDRTMSNLSEKKEKFNLQGSTPHFDEALAELHREWQEMKAAVFALQDRAPSANREALMETSERCWAIANRMVTEAQAVSETKVRNFHRVLLIIGVNTLVVFLGLWLIRVHVRKRLENLAHHDSLTDLLNRHSYGETIQTELARAHRYGRRLSLILFDIDRFKQINDTHGHRTGDQVLAMIGRVVRQNVRRSDIVFRIGGEEFAVIAVETDAREARRLAEKIRKAVQESALPEISRVTVSMGFAALKPDDDERSLFIRADQALYRAKDAGRNCTKMAR